MDSIFSMTFEESIGNWLDIIGKASKKSEKGKLLISNTNIDGNVESVSLATDSPIENEGEVSLDFLYENQKCFGLVFRAENNASNWQSVSYMGEGIWQVGQPGGSWISDIDGPVLLQGKNYILSVIYIEKSIRILLNNVEFYKNDYVTYPNGVTISDDQEGKIGVRLFANLQTLTINELSYKSKEYNNHNFVIQINQIKEKWKTSLVGNEENNLADTDVKQYVDTLSKNSENLLSTLNKSNDRSFLWARKSGDTNSSDLSTQFKNILVLAKAYGTKGTTLYQNNELLTQIVSCFDFLIQDGKYSGNKYFGNWFDWQVTIPQNFLNSLIILTDEINISDLKNYLRIISRYVPNPFNQMYGKSQDSSFDLQFIPNFETTGANRTDLAFSVLGVGILGYNQFKINQSISSIEIVFKYVESDDGFYKDGSFIQHTNIPYAGSYGSDLVRGISDMYDLVYNTMFAPDTEILHTLSKIVFESFIPVIQKGEPFSYVMGRGISRPPSNNKKGFGSFLIINLIAISEILDNKEIIQEATKYWIKENESYYLENARSLKELFLVKMVLNDSNVVGDKKPFIGSHSFNSMDRYAYGDSNIQLGISMYSNRIAAFEAGNGENKRGWHTSDGMLYFINDDNQFSSAYWPTIDPYRLPGITVDTVRLQDEVTSFSDFLSYATHVGSLSVDMDAISSMQLNKTNTRNNNVVLPMNLKAKKSWFILSGVVICLGTDINGTTSATIETIIENRMLDNNTNYVFKSSNGIVNPNSYLELKEFDWLLLEADQENKSIGYIMLLDTEVKNINEQRTGNYSQIGSSTNQTNYTEGYQTILIDHGKKIDNASYGYIYYPNATEEKLELYKDDPIFSVIENNSTIQAVKDNDRSIVLANVWSKTGTSIEGIEVDGPCQLYFNTNGNRLSMYVSNPNQIDMDLKIILPFSIEEVIEKSDNITINEDGKELFVNFKNNPLEKTFIVIDK